ncbi:hypothetical protein CAOG_07642 [Capsaspora owczarzaki ATCC 30864]|uniref:Uncharacterized protein n=1 Tax=Capsaspora owczarzaki (strain ATCC 30864) TaxID=595528 RepID=A0A0D2UQC0_CAPO3|nr:hypothetical protein CAOG_07642 [Capsaspora owczarzaki ATCC 30864]KJE97196.1 hypothetical protein CAOG_007642 [Capsaspora owczarzaki ATCC 30864]|eukprot:XP_004343516.1 hypothetical protein CAOG_07642 [Capsaspora owczarzaki ATCC 30864]
MPQVEATESLQQLVRDYLATQVKKGQQLQQKHKQATATTTTTTTSDLRAELQAAQSAWDEAKAKATTTSTTATSTTSTTATSTSSKEAVDEATPLQRPALLIEFALVKRLWQQLKQDQPALTLHKVLHGSQIVPPAMPEIVRSPELVARLAKLKVLVEEKNYARMTRGLTAHAEEPNINPLELKKVEQIFSLIFGTILSGVAVFAAGYKVSEQVFPGNTAMMVLCGMLAAFVALGAELYFIIKFSL